MQRRIAINRRPTSIATGYTKERRERLVEKELTALEKIELAGKFAAVSLPLTYVSGYLISTSYLGTYGIQLLAGDFFRAKYIYIGFLYLIFLTLSVVIFWTLMRVTAFFRIVLRSPAVTEKLVDERRKALVELEKDSKTQGTRNRRSFQRLRGRLVVGLVVLVFSSEIIFMNPSSVNGILPLQILFLLAVAIYQLTFYWSLTEPFTWGLVYGRRYIEDVRWLLWWAQLLSAFAIMARLLRNYLIQAQPSSTLISLFTLIMWFLATLVMEFEILGLASLFARAHRLQCLDKNSRFDPMRWIANEDVMSEVMESLGRCRSVTGSLAGYFNPCASRWRRVFFIRRTIYLGIPMVAAIVLFRSKFLAQAPLAINGVLMILPLILALLVLGNIGMITLLIARRQQRLGFRESPGEEHFWSYQILESDTKSEKWESYGRRAIMASVLYVTSVLSFGYVVYPHIPVQKAGGNYATANAVCVTLAKDLDAGECSSRVLPPRNSTDEAFIQLEEDAEKIYLANDHDANGTSAWIWAGLQPSGALAYPRPRVFVVNRRCVVSTFDALPQGQGDVCSSGEVSSPESYGRSNLGAR